jgi:hypothetical protein
MSGALGIHYICQNISIHTYTLLHCNMLSSYWAHKNMWISAPFNTFCPHRSQDSSLLFLSTKHKTHWHVHHSTASHTLMDRTSYNEGQTTTIQCTMLPSLNSLPSTSSLPTRKRVTSLKYPHIIRPAPNSEPQYSVIMSNTEQWTKTSWSAPSVKGLSWSTDGSRMERGNWGYSVWVMFGVEGQHLGLQCLGNVWGGGSTSGATVFG